MKVKFKTNLGSRDAAECSQQCGAVVDHAQCTAGTEVEVNNKVAEWLGARGLLVDPVVPKKPKPKTELKAVPEEPVISKATEPLLKK